MARRRRCQGVVEAAEERQEGKNLGVILLFTLSGHCFLQQQQHCQRSRTSQPFAFGHTEETRQEAYPKVRKLVNL